MLASFSKRVIWLRKGALMRSRVAGLLVAVCLVALGEPLRAGASSLTEKLNRSLQTSILGGLGVANPQALQFTSLVTDVIQREALTGIDFPVPPSSPAF